MGYAFFNKSGTFNPLDYGLTAGDVLEVVVVGGGAGGGCYSAHGGVGGTSSFGSYATALGGSSRVLQGAYRPGRSAVGKYSEIVSSGPNRDAYYACGGGGAGGYIPGYALSGGNGSDGFFMETAVGSGGQSGGDIYLSVTVPVPNGSGGMGAFHVYRAGAVMTGASSGASSGASFSDYSYLQWGFRGNAGLACGGGAGGQYNYSEMYNPGGGGSGYGAGGGGGAASSSSSKYYAGHGGASGEVVRTTIRLMSDADIPVTIGGGGAGATDSTAGANGSAGAGAPRNMNSDGKSYGGAGGYAGKSGETGYVKTNSTECGGGGAGGCVEIFW